MRIGLRGRFVAVLVGVAALTLAVAAVTLLSPLDARLRADAVRTLSSELRDGRGALTPLRAADLRAPSRQASPGPTRGRRSGPPTGLPRDVPLRRAIRSLRRRTLAEIELFDGRGRSLLPGEGGEQDVDRDLIRTALRVPGVHTRTHESRHPPEAVAALAVQLRDGSTVVAQATQSLRSVDNAVDVVARAVVLAGIAGLVGALLVGTLLAGRIVRRLRRLRATALRVARDGPAAEMPSETGTDEVADLSRAFATMQRRLREQEEARKAFVATASHELRTPLSSLRLMLDMLRGDLEAQPPALADARDQAARAETQTERLSTLADQLLQLSRVDAGLPPRTEPVQVDEVVRSVVAEFDVRIADERRDVTLTIDGERWVDGDPGAVAQIVRILVDNALRHARGAPVRVVVGATASAPALRVEDDGPGVPAAQRESIFLRFARGQDAGEGFGLGLAIARELARSMGGELTLDPAAPGARFVLTLPEGAPR
ncbi:putative two-component system sensor kinase [Patulibacter medicamentivorans]|uniref:histidine kinase n=1 Tax=Patulibacter medicamentivorans TaxID=1097667 RepID=H0E487_9ACTN|nr:HAMP domain-containing sensor histidine kinase [Patulibacter medicamentivorans]EHN11503.1 putative two-component system sensor kinase [Patulibacter medicamentivorans]